MMAELECGQAVFWDITRHFSDKYNNLSIPVIEPEIAGQHLAHLSDEHELVLYECFLPDLIGHRKDVTEALKFLEILDRFLKGLLDEMGPNVNLVVSSDHGNLEDMEKGSHTKNQVPLLVVGPDAGIFQKAEVITDVAEGIMAVLERKRTPHRGL